MDHRSAIRAFKNTLLSFGAYYASTWLYWPLQWLWSFVSNRLSFTQGVESMLLMPFLLGVPEMLVAFCAGMAVSATVEANRPSRWAFITAAFFVVRHASARYFWAHPPTFEERGEIIVAAALPVVACILGAIVVETPRRRSRR
jgi:hypothetical protein